MTQSPNILIVLTDQMRSTAMGCAGVEPVFTPNLDAFADQGVRYTNAVSNTPACTPARATLLTGKHVLQHGLVQNEQQLGREHRTIADCLNGADYRCSYIGKLHLDGVNRGAYIPRGPRRLGFDDFWAATECNHRYFQGYYYPDVPADAPTPEPIWFDCYEPDGQTDLAIEFLGRQQDQNTPFCLVVSWGPPHCPYHVAPEKYKQMYPPESIELMPTAQDAQIKSMVSDDLPHQMLALSPEEAALQKKTVIAGYYAHCSALDACFGRLMDGLDEYGLADNTIVLFTSDHGDMLFSQNRGWKCKPWRESVGIPFLMRWPDHISADTVSNAPISLADVMPTLLGLAGVHVPEDINGIDLSGFVTGDNTQAPSHQYINFPCMNALWDMPGWRGIVTDQYTYVVTPDGPWLLYDDVADPFQKNNLIEDSGHAGVRQVLDRLLREELRKTDDDLAPPNVIAERFIDNPKWNHIPIPPLDPVIAEGQEERKANKY